MWVPLLMRNVKNIGVVMRASLPNVMVLAFEERLGHSMWMEYEHHRKRTLRSLVNHLASEVKAGRFVGYLLYRRELSITGICPETERAYLAKAEAANVAG